MELATVPPPPWNSLPQLCLWSSQRNGVNSSFYFWKLFSEKVYQKQPLRVLDESWCQRAYKEALLNLMGVDSHVMQPGSVPPSATGFHSARMRYSPEPLWAFSHLLRERRTCSQPLPQKQSSLFFSFSLPLLPPCYCSSFLPFPTFSLNMEGFEEEREGRGEKFETAQDGLGKHHA